MTRLPLVPKTVLFSGCAWLGLAACGGDAEAGSQASAEAVPDSFDVALQTSRGEATVRFHRSWSPRAVDRVYELVELGFYDGARFYRVNDQYAQFGFSGRPALDNEWMERRLPDEPVRASNVRGAVSFGRAGPHGRNFALFVNLVDNSFLDTWAGDGVAGFPPVGRVVEGLDVLESLEARYGDEIVPMEDSILAGGNAFLARRYPGLDSIVDATVARRW